MAAAGCGDDDSGGEDVGELRVGVLAPLTGRLASTGRSGAAAADRAAGQINAAAKDGGRELRVSLVKEDTESDPQRAQEAATKLIDRDGVTAIAGPWASAETIPTAENVTIAAAVPIVSPSSADPAISDLDDDGLVFRAVPSDALQGRALAQLAAEELGPGASVVTAHRDDSSGVAVIDEFTSAWVAGGGRVLRDVAYDPEAAGLDREARLIARGDPDGWVIADVPETWRVMGPALVRAGGWDPARTFAAGGLRSPSLPAEAGTASTAGMRGTAPASLDDDRAFDAVALIALAAAAGGSGDPAAIAANIPAVSRPPGREYASEQLRQAILAAARGDEIDYEGASGRLDLDDNGDPAAADYRVWSYAAGRLVDTDRVIAVTADG